MQLLNKVLTGILATAILICVGLTICISMTPNPRDNFTEFYILNTEGIAANYPRAVSHDVPVELIAGIVNHEKRDIKYTIKITAGDQTIKTFETPVLGNEEKWEEKINFLPLITGKDQRYQFYLFSDTDDKPHIKDPLVLILDVE